MTRTEGSGLRPAKPLDGRKILEFGGLGPTPFAGMLLAELGADVLRIDRSGGLFAGSRQTYHRSRPALKLDLKTTPDRDLVSHLVAQADASIEGFRPGAMERLGFGPENCLKVNPRLVYGRMTGWGQYGPWAQRPGHDINYLSMTGALDSFRRDGEMPVPPMNLLGDFGGGSMFLIVGLLSGMMQADRTGRGQIVDAAIVDGVASMMASMCGRLNDGTWSPEPGTNLLDMGAPFYQVYETADDRFMAVGAIEATFYADLVEALGFDSDELPPQFEKQFWPELTRRFAKRFRARTQTDWIEVFEHIDACVTPVLTIEEAFDNEHLRARSTYRDVGYGMEPATAPRLTSADGTQTCPTDDSFIDLDAVSNLWGIEPQWVDRLSSNSTKPAAVARL